MNYKLLLIFLAISCGKVNHNGKLKVEKVPIEHTIGIQTMYKELITLCDERFVPGTFENDKCRQDVQDDLLTLLDNINLEN